MLFNSLAFAVFLPIVTLLFYLTPQRYRWFILLGASCYFYMCYIPAYIIIVLFLITVDYSAGRLIERAPQNKKKYFLWVSLLTNLLMLGTFKYLGFMTLAVNQLASALGWHYSLSILHLVLPLGLSFHTFQSLSYVIEVYLGRVPAERRFGHYALYVMFFPQLVAGPIERPGVLLPQLHAVQRFNYDNITEGLQRILLGLFKKLVIADRLAIVVDQIYLNPASYHGPALAGATVLFAYQVYCDFSGYSDIAIGAARILGFRLTENFNRPFASRSIAEFWQRWHISLSFWFRDYVLTPLAFWVIRISQSRRVLGIPIDTFAYLVAIPITWALCGLWHGANWTFLVLGLMHGFYLIFGMLTRKIRAHWASQTGLAQRPRVHATIQVLVTFFLFAFSTIFFRAANLHDAGKIITNLVSGWGTLLQPAVLWTHRTTGFGLFTTANVLTALLSIGLLEIIQFYAGNRGFGTMLTHWPRWCRWLVYYGLIFWLFFGGRFTEQQFVYFQF